MYLFNVLVDRWVRTRNREWKDRRRDFDQTEKDNRMTNSYVGRLTFHLGLVIVIKCVGEWCVMWERKKQKEILSRMVSSDSEFHWTLNGEGEKGKEWKDAKSPVVNFTIRNSVTILVKSSDFWQLHKYLQTITQQKRRKKKRKSGWIPLHNWRWTIQNGQRRWTLFQLNRI